MHDVCLVITMLALATIHSQFKITDYYILESNGHNLVFFNQSGAHILFTTYKNHKLIVKGL